MGTIPVISNQPLPIMGKCICGENVALYCDANTFIFKHVDTTCSNLQIVSINIPKELPHTLECILTVPIPYHMRNVCVLDNGNLAIGTLEGVVLIHDGCKILSQLKTAYSYPITSICAYGNEIISGSLDGSIRLWSGEICKLTLKNHTDMINDFLITKDNKLVSSSRDRNIKTWNLLTGKNESTPQTIISGSLGGIIDTLKDYTNKSYIALVNDKIITADKYTLSICEVQIPLEGITCLKTSPDGRIFTGLVDKTLRMWNLEGKCESILYHEDFVNDIAFLKDGTIISISDDKTLKMWK